MTVLYHPIYGAVEPTNKHGNERFAQVRLINSEVPGGIKIISVGRRVLSKTPHNGKMILVPKKDEKK